MVGPTAQLVALASLINTRARGILVPTMFPDHSTCQFNEYVHFLRQQRAWMLGKRTWKTVARSPDEWINAVFKSGGRAARVVYRPIGIDWLSARMSAGFVGGGGEWSLLVMHGRKCDRWQAQWRVGNQAASDRRIWQARYLLVAAGEPIPPTDRPSAEVLEDLKETLAEIEAFARRNRIDGFADEFRIAQECANSEDPLSLVYHKDLSPVGTVGLDGLRLLAACQKAWVFGGMGSWNDISFSGATQQEHERLSDALFGLVNEGICSGANDGAIL